jgi:hypothetical protein
LGIGSGTRRFKRDGFEGAGRWDGAEGARREVSLDQDGRKTQIVRLGGSEERPGRKGARTRRF